MNRQETIEITTHIFVEEFGVESTAISPEANFREGLGLSSLDYADLVVIIRQEFGVKLVKTGFKEIVTFEDFYTALANKVNAQ